MAVRMASRPGTWLLAWREARRRWFGLVLTALAVAGGVGGLTAGQAVLRAHDRDSEALLQAHEAATAAGLEDYDRALGRSMRRLGYNVVVLPAEQDLGDFHADGFARATLPEESLRALAAARPRSVLGVVPVLRRKVVWPERGWTVQVQAFGTPLRLDDAGELPEVLPVPAGQVDVGWELHRGLDLRPGMSLEIMGRTLAVRQCRPERGTIDDLTVWMDLAEAQALLGLSGRLSEIHALAAPAVWQDLDSLRAEVAAVLPGARAVVRGREVQTLSEARAAFAASRGRLLEQTAGGRQDQRRRRARLFGAVAVLGLALAAGVSGLSAWSNARERRVEVALWSALGVAPVRVAALLGCRAVLAVLAGSAVGVSIGVLGWGWPGLGAVLRWGLLGLAAAGLLALPAAVAAVLLALRQEPAIVLRNEV